MSTNDGWIGVDLDGTLARYDGWKGSDHIGEPIPAMVERVLAWIKDGKQVKIFTARVSDEACKLNKEDKDDVIMRIVVWCQEHLGTVLPITCHKDMGMIELWDDRCVSVEINTGRVLTAGR